MSNILSASSKTNVFIFSKTILPCWICFKTLPGVATTICAPWLKDKTWGLNGVPPHKVRTFTLWICLESFLNSWAIWFANSLVGAKIKDWTLNSLIFNLFTIGIQNATVFPEPVFACAIKSLLFKLKGKLCCWIVVSFV